MPSRYFPPADAADADGLVCVGGSLEPEWLLDAYRHGIFPWPIFDGDQPNCWWSPDPRAVIEIGSLHVSRRLRQTCRRQPFEITCDRDFAGVIHGCASAQNRQGETWLTEEMVEAYRHLHHLGHAHSVEAYQAGELVGGVYGVACGGLFAAESMFYRLRDASKVALVHLFQHITLRGYQLFDIQQLTSHSASLGAVEIPRKEYLQRLATAIELDVQFGDKLEQGKPTGQ